MLRDDRASRSLGMQLLELSSGAARVQMTVTAEMTNGHGICHGGLIFTLADSAFAFACNSHGESAVAAAASIDFLAPAATGDVLTAEAREFWHVGRTGLCDVVVRRADGTMIAQFRGRSQRIPPPKVSR
jgi:acyl-CoA thioesterase